MLEDKARVEEIESLLSDLHRCHLDRGFRSPLSYVNALSVAILTKVHEYNSLYPGNQITLKDGKVIPLNGKNGALESYSP